MNKLNELTPYAPKIGVIKDGYQPDISSAHHKVEYKWIIRKYFYPADYRKNDFKLHRMTLREMLTDNYGLSVSGMSDDVADIMNRGCWWEKLPKTIMALERLKDKAKEQGFKLDFGIATRKNIPKDRGCKDPKQVFWE